MMFLNLAIMSANAGIARNEPTPEPEPDTLQDVLAEALTSAEPGPDDDLTPTMESGFD